MYAHSIRFLMCAPDHYEVDKVINPWMEGNIHKSIRNRAVEEWQNLYQIIKARAVVNLMIPKKGWTDMVFAANAGLVSGDSVVLGRFCNKERRGEEPYFKKWFEQNGFTIYEVPADLPFEGAGCCLRELSHD